ncbi:hypothetical protein SDC9_107849 [bioreactor metagenome]|uniref:NAD-specific glutamate dehydrogenase n=1 Tax=bioreactor metagenome TaxID=1076179 RepID=A0A645B6D9_9ZZZZ
MPDFQGVQLEARGEQQLHQHLLAGLGLYRLGGGGGGIPSVVVDAGHQLHVHSERLTLLLRLGGHDGGLRVLHHHGDHGFSRGGGLRGQLHILGQAHNLHGGGGGGSPVNILQVGHECGVLVVQLLLVHVGNQLAPGIGELLIGDFCVLDGLAVVVVVVAAGAAVVLPGVAGVAAVAQVGGAVRVCAAGGVVGDFIDLARNVGHLSDGLVQNSGLAIGGLVHQLFLAVGQIVVAVGAVFAQGLLHLLNVLGGQLIQVNAIQLVNDLLGLVKVGHQPVVDGLFRAAVEAVKNGLLRAAQGVVVLLQGLQVLDGAVWVVVDPVELLDKIGHLLVGGQLLLDALLNVPIQAVQLGLARVRHHGLLVGGELVPVGLGGLDGGVIRLIIGRCQGGDFVLHSLGVLAHGLQGVQFGLVRLGEGVFLLLGQAVVGVFGRGDLLLGGGGVGLLNCPQQVQYAVDGAQIGMNMPLVLHGGGNLIHQLLLVGGELVIGILRRVLLLVGAAGVLVRLGPIGVGELVDHLLGRVRVARLFLQLLDGFGRHTHFDLVWQRIVILLGLLNFLNRVGAIELVL